MTQLQQYSCLNQVWPLISYQIANRIYITDRAGTEGTIQVFMQFLFTAKIAVPHLFLERGSNLCGAIPQAKYTGYNLNHPGL